MKIVAIIQARMGSSRLPNKVMMPISETPILGWMIERVSACSEIDEIVIATTTSRQDDLIANFFQGSGCSIFRGSEHDVLDRYYRAAKKFNADLIVRITGDCPLLDPRILKEMIEYFLSERPDFLSNSEPLPSSWPDGMDISIITIEALTKAWLSSRKPSEREHVTFYFWNNPNQFKCRRIEHIPDLSNYRITLDYEEDFELIKRVIENFGAKDSEKLKNISMDQIINFIKDDPGLYKINHKYTRGLGWKESFDKDRDSDLTLSSNKSSN